MTTGKKERRRANGHGSRYVAREIVIAVLAGVILAGLGVGWTLLPNRNEECTGSPVSVQVPEQTGPSLQTGIQVDCLAPEGMRYVLMVQVLNVGRDGPHSEFYPSLALDLSKRGHYTDTRDISDSEIGSERDIYVLAVDDGQYAQLGQPDPATGVLLDLPAGLQTVSARVRTKRTY